MKARSVNSFLIPVLMAGLGLLLAGRVTAQTFTTVHSFTSSSDGANPYAGLILSGNTLYGTAEAGGSHSEGTVFAVHTDGTVFTNLHSFTAVLNSTNSDGANPYAGLILSGNTLYGTARLGGTSGNGTVFAVHTDGTSFTNLHSFTTYSYSGSNYTNSDGALPYAGLILSGNTLYGTAYQGGTSGNGTVFAVNTDGTDFTNLHSFTSVSDGGYPYAGLILSGNTLYGTAKLGGSGGNGTVFAVNTDGTGFTNLYSFTALLNSTNSDGANPEAGLILSGNTLYGTAGLGGSSFAGTVFAVKTNGTGFTNLYSFTSASYGPYYPEARLILLGNTLYGTTFQGGISNRGTVFAVTANGTGFTNLHSFTRGSDGGYTQAGLILSGNTLYGTAIQGGSSGQGTVFSINLALNITTNGLSVSQLSGGMAQLTYLGTPGAKFALDWAHGLNTPIIWTPLATNTTTPDGYLIFTNTASGTNDFYRIRSVP